MFEIKISFRKKRHLGYDYYRKINNDPVFQISLNVKEVDNCNQISCVILDRVLIHGIVNNHYILTDSKDETLYVMKLRNHFKNPYREQSKIINLRRK